MRIALVLLTLALSSCATTQTFDLVMKGDSRDQVLERLGPPDAAGSSPNLWSYSGDCYRGLIGFKNDEVEEVWSKTNAACANRIERRQDAAIAHRYLMSEAEAKQQVEMKIVR